METMRNFVRDNYVLFIFGVLLLLIASLGGLGNRKMEYHSCENGVEIVVQNSLY